MRSHIQIDPAPSAEIPLPGWMLRDRAERGALLQRVTGLLGDLALRYVVFRGSRVAYLRHLGAQIGEGCDILTDVKNFGSEPWLIELGSRVTLTSGVVLLTHDGANRVFRDHLPNASRWGNRFGIIVIENNCFIGVNAIIMPGVRIGHDSIVGVGSVVNRDVPPRMVVAGVPARPIATLDEYIERYREKMLPITAITRADLRHELTTHLWGEPR